MVGTQSVMRENWERHYREQVESGNMPGEESDGSYEPSFGLSPC